LRRRDEDDLTVVACGITVGEAEKAAERLQLDGVRVRVIDCYSVEPIDTDTLRAAARETGGIVTGEHHSPAGGLGEAVLSALAEEAVHPPVAKLAVRDVPISGETADPLRAAGIDAGAAPGDLTLRRRSSLRGIGDQPIAIYSARCLQPEKPARPSRLKFGPFPPLREAAIPPSRL
jgi:hypothetical protein